MAPSAQERAFSSIEDLSGRIRSKEVSPVEVTELMLARIDEPQSQDPRLLHRLP